VSVAHEALLREWQRVKEGLTENREFLRMRDRLDSSLKLWLSRGKQKDDLLEPGLHLSEGEKLVKDFGPSLSREQTDYVHSSIAEQSGASTILESLLLKAELARPWSAPAYNANGAGSFAARLPHITRISISYGFWCICISGCTSSDCINIVTL
jgi:hypothetical protein